MKQDKLLGPYSTPGHYYSPLYTSQQARDYLASPLYQSQCERVDALLNISEMQQTWNNITPHTVSFPFPQTPGFRYRADNRFFEYLDATVLSGLLGWLRPRQVIEIGAGFSSAAMFDTFDRMKSSRLETFTTIDPDLARVQSLAPPPEAHLMEDIIQNVPISRFEELQADDILFIDSSHVMKTASDVHYIYLHILPRLNPGVVVHIHDVFYPFEYPRRWIVRQPRYWNEAHIVDVMLTHGNTFDILFFVDAFVQKCGQNVETGREIFERFSSFKKRPWHWWNGSLWLRKS